MAKRDEANTRAGIVMLHPCYTKGHSMGEITIGRKFDIKKTAESLDKEFSKVSFSPDLGVVKVEEDEKTIFLFANGLLRVRRAKDKQDVIDTVEKVVSLLK